MKIAKLAWSVLVTGILLCSIVAVPSEAAAQIRQKPKIVMTNPVKGSVVHPGDQVEIAWRFTIEPSGSSSWCEQEIFLSLDGGVTIERRLTLALDPSTRRYLWTVPDVASDKAVLDIHYGCETSTFPHEVPNVQKSAPFKIVRDGRPHQSVALRAPAKIKQGEVVTVDWDSTVENASSFDVFVSFNRGGEFSPIGSTTGQTLAWRAPADYSGTLMFRVVANRPDGSVVESPMMFKDLVVVVR